MIHQVPRPSFSTMVKNSVFTIVEKAWGTGVLFEKRFQEALVREGEDETRKREGNW